MSPSSSETQRACGCDQSAPGRDRDLPSEGLQPWRGAEPARPGVRSTVPLEHDPEPVEGEPGLIVLDRAGERQDELGEPAGGDDRAVPQLALEALDQRVDLPGEAVHGARL